MKLLIVFILILVVIAIAQAARVYELARNMSPRKEEDVNLADNNANAYMWLVTMVIIIGSFFYLCFRYWDVLMLEPASVHGVEIDALMKFNLWLVSAIFVVMNGLLFFFAFKYRYRKGDKAFYYPHNNKLEMIWTLIPALTMAVIIVYGLMVWNDITDVDNVSEEALHVQLYGKQFDWTARYGGEDGKLGESSFNFITATNPLGLITSEVYDEALQEVTAQLESARKDLREDRTMPDNVRAENEAKMKRLERHRVRILSYDRESEEYDYAKDDIIADKGVFYLPVDQEVEFAINSRDVIHSAFMPQFRMQMNAVPGMTTRFRMTPTITTAEMKVKREDPDFEYFLLCNKICGAAHYNMKMIVKIVEREEYDKWMAEQKPFAGEEEGETQLSSTDK